MARYSIDGINYEIDDKVDLTSTVAAIRSLPTHKKQEDLSYGKRILTEGIPGAAAGMGNLAIDIARSAPAGLIGLGTAIGTGSMERGMEEFEHEMEASKGAIPEIPDPSGGALMGILEKGMGYTGDLGEAQSQPGGPMNMAPAPELASPGMRTGAEAIANFLPIPGARMAGRLPHVGSEWKAIQAAKQAKEAQASNILQNRLSP